MVGELGDDANALSDLLNRAFDDRVDAEFPGNHRHRLSRDEGQTIAAVASLPPVSCIVWGEIESVSD